jgi:aldose 1-epimerase
MTAPFGRDVVLRSGDYEAHVVEVGAGLRTLARAGLDVVEGYGPDEMCSGARGQLLAPWPNRIEDGRYEFAGNALQLALTEAAAHNAIHGLVRWAPWQLSGSTGSSAQWAYRLFPQPGYPFALDLTATYELAADGLRLTITASNEADTAVPYGFGWHPYLTVGRDLDGCLLDLPAAEYCPVDERGLPGAARAVDGTEFDFREARAVGATVLDNPFGAVGHGADGWGAASLVDPETGRTATVAFDESIRWLQVFSADSHAGTPRQYLAVEPMTCPPNAFRTGADVIGIEAGQTHTATIRIS